MFPSNYVEVLSGSKDVELEFAAANLPKKFSYGGRPVWTQPAFIDLFADPFLDSRDDEVKKIRGLMTITSSVNFFVKVSW